MPRTDFFDVAVPITVEGFRSQPEPYRRGLVEGVRAGIALAALPSKNIRIAFIGGPAIPIGELATIGAPATTGGRTTP